MSKLIRIDGTCAGIQHFASLARSTYTKRSRSDIEQAERDAHLQRRMKVEGHKSELICLSYGGSPETEDGKLLVSSWTAREQRDSLKHTTKGDFTHLHCGRNELR